MCALGEDVTDLEIDYWKGGKVSKKSLADALRECFHELGERLVWPRLRLVALMMPIFIFE